MVTNTQTTSGLFRRALILLLLAFGLRAAMPAAHAAPGGLDPLNAAVVGSWVLATAVQPDGKTIIAGGFTSVLGQTRNNIARLNADGTLDAGFNPNVNGTVRSVAVQADGRILLGGSFSIVGGTARNCIARVDAAGALDADFNPNANNWVFSVAVQADGRILLGGWFTSVGGTARNFIARVDAAGALDAGFNPNANSRVHSVAVQADGRILLGGAFTSMGGIARGRIARVDAAGALDADFNPNANDWVYSVAVQADGRILLGGWFTNVGGIARNRIARVDAAGALDAGFNPNANNYVYSVAVQADGRILLGGDFTTVGGIARNRIARVDAVGALDAGFNPNANNYVESVAVQADGRILLGGEFTTVGGITRNKFARLLNDPATQTLSAPDATHLTWIRGGSSPEVSQVTFEQSTDGGATWSPLGSGTRIGTTANWQLTGLALPATGQLRARGRTTGGFLSSSSGLVEAVSSFSFAPEIAVEESALDIADGGSRDFGTVLIGGSSSLTFTIKNTGNADLTGLGITIDGADAADFAVTANPTAPVAGPSGSTTFTVTFAPSTFGPKSAALHIASNDEAPFDIALGGNVAAPRALVNDAATTTTGTTRIYPLANDINAGAIIAVSDPAIVIDGRALIIPAGFAGSFTYTTSNGVANGQATVDVTAGTPIAAPTKWQGLLYDADGAIAGIVRASQFKTTVTASVTLGLVTGRARFPATGATGVAFTLGTLDGSLGADGRIAITVLNSGATYTADLRPQAATATAGKHNIALAGADAGVVPGGGFLRVSIGATNKMFLSGKLSDGRAVSAGSALLDNGSFVFYRGIGKTVPKAFIGGEIIGANLAATDVTGELEWNLPPQAAGLHAAGVNAVLVANGCIFNPANSLPTGPVTLTLRGANLAGDIVVASTANNGTVAKTVEVPSFTASATKGTFSAKVKHPAFAKPVSASGVFLQKSGTAWGYFPGVSVGGSIHLAQP